MIYKGPKDLKNLIENLATCVAHATTHVTKCNATTPGLRERCEHLETCNPLNHPKVYNYSIPKSSENIPTMLNFKLDKILLVQTYNKIFVKKCSTNVILHINTLPEKMATPLRTNSLH